MRWLALTIGVAALLWCRRQWQRMRPYRDINDDSARRRLEALTRAGDWNR